MQITRKVTPDQKASKRLLTEIEKERLYEKSMWILRQFAGNLDQDVYRIRALNPSQTNSA